MDVYTDETISALDRVDGCGALVAGAVCFALTHLLTKAYLQQVPLGVCVLSRLPLALPFLHGALAGRDARDRVDLPTPTLATHDMVRSLLRPGPQLPLA